MGLKEKFELFIDTDIIAAHLTGESHVLLKSVSLFTCFTSVINAGEIFSVCNNTLEIDKAKKAFFGLNVLGIPYRYSVTAGKVFNHIKKKIFG